MFLGNRKEENRMYKYRLSILAPVYNVETYLERCVRSIENQDIPKEDYEVLLIDDGSTDKSLSIANRLAKEYSNIVVYSKPNEGLSQTRNFGLEHAQGKYIMHVDSDDFLIENTIGKILEVADENQLELCFYDAKTTWGYIQPRPPLPLYQIFTGENVLLHGMRVGSVWKNIYLHDFLKKTGIRFYGNIAHQDVEYNYRLYPFAQKVMFTDICVYVYNKDNESITRTNDICKKEKKVKDDLTVISNVSQFAHSAEISLPLKNLLIRKMNSSLIAILYSFLRKDSHYSFSFCKEILQNAQTLSLYPIQGDTYSKKTTQLKKWINVKPLYLVLLAACKFRNYIHRIIKL